MGIIHTGALTGGRYDLGCNDYHNFCYYFFNAASGAWLGGIKMRENMTIKRIRLIYFSVCGASIVGCLGMLLLGVINEYNSWNYSSILFLVFFGIALISTIIYLISHTIVLPRENSLILKEFGTSESRNKTYYYYTSITIAIPALAGKKKHINKLAFNSVGVFYNYNKPLFYWESVKSICSVSELIIINLHIPDVYNSGITFPNEPVFIALINTFSSIPICTAAGIPDSV